MLKTTGGQKGKRKYRYTESMEITRIQKVPVHETPSHPKTSTA
jgi:hypothetical protein